MVDRVPRQGLRYRSFPCLEIHKFIKATIFSATASEPKNHELEGRNNSTARPPKMYKNKKKFTSSRDYAIVTRAR